MSALRATAPVVRPLDLGDLASLRAMIDADPYANAVLAARLDAMTMTPRPRDLIGVGAPGELSGACYTGGTLLPVGGDAPAWTALAAHLTRYPRTCSSIVGPADAVAMLWPALASSWGAARGVRACQPLLATSRPAALAPDPNVRPARRHELDSYLPAAAAMFDEELGLAPLRGPNARAYRARIAELIAAGHAFLRTDARGEVVFKAELAAVSRSTSQVQGVWVRPDCRGRGLGTAAMAAVIEYALCLAPSVSLYVNDYNLTARRLYARLGMRQVGTLATVLF